MQNSKAPRAFQRLLTRFQQFMGGTPPAVACPPKPVRRLPRCKCWDDTAGWDVYWEEALQLPPRQLRDYFCGIIGLQWLREVLRKYPDGKPARLLFMGNGLSALPWAFAHAGHQSIVLDVSRVATDYLMRSPVPEEYVRHYFQGQGSSFEDCQRAGGSVDIVCGSVFDLAAAPGAFDVIFAERSLQGFPPDRIAAAVRALAARLTDTGSCYVTVVNSNEACKLIKSEFTALGFAVPAPREPATDLSSARVLHLGFVGG